MNVEVFSFFSGLGFLDLGFENAGFNIVFVNEHDKRFLSAYQYARRNSGHTPVYGYSEELQIGYKDAERDKEAVCTAIETISLFFVSDSVTKFLRRKAQLYTLFSVVFYMQRENIEIEQYQKDRLESFVKLYSIFDNDMDLTGEISDQEKTLFDWLKKYKLASSEGLNKHTNRMIRYNVMKDFLFGLSDELEAARLTLYEKMQANSTVAVKEDPED
jgi:hypothetical protein